MASAPVPPMSPTAASRTAILQPLEQHNATLIFVHGLGDQGSSWAPAFKPLQQTLKGLKVVCPTAPVVPVTLNFGMRMTSWHDIRSLDKIDGEDFKGLDESVKCITSLIDDEIKNGIPAERIVVGGFSQGAAVVVLAAYQCKQKLAGVCCMSGYLPFQGDFSTVVNENNKKTPALVTHGETDTVVKVENGRKLADAIEKAGAPVTLKLYKEVEHVVTDEAQDDINNFIIQLLK